MSTTRNLALEKSLLDVPVRVDVVLGEALERETSELVDIYVSDRLMARGRLVVADGQLGVTLSEIVDAPAAT